MFAMQPAVESIGARRRFLFDTTVNGAGSVAIHQPFASGGLDAIRQVRVEAPSRAYVKTDRVDGGSFFRTLPNISLDTDRKNHERNCANLLSFPEIKRIIVNSISVAVVRSFKRKKF